MEQRNTLKRDPYTLKRDPSAVAKLTIAIGALLLLVGRWVLCGPDGFDRRTAERHRVDSGLRRPPDLFARDRRSTSGNSQARHARSGGVALLGCVLPIGHLSRKLAQGADVRATAVAAMVLMALLCGILLIACIRSFVRPDSPASPHSPPAQRETHLSQRQRTPPS